MNQEKCFKITNKRDIEFHKRRDAFIIIENQINYIGKTGLSHWEFCREKGVSKENFLKLIRGVCIR